MADGAKPTPPRVVNGPTFLAGIARCGYCGAAMIQNTGKGGLYRYYCCSSKLKKGSSACRGLRTPMGKLDEIVVGEVARQVLDPDRLTAMLGAHVQSAAAQADGGKAQLAKLRHHHTATVAGIARLVELVEKGLMEPEDPAMRERLVALKIQRDRIAKEIGELQNRLAASTPTITPEKVARVGGLLRDKLYEGSEFRQAYARLLMDEVRLTDEEICISGSKICFGEVRSKGLPNLRPEFSLLFRGGAPEEIRTPDPQIRSLVLYPAELRALRSAQGGESEPCARAGSSCFWRSRQDRTSVVAPRAALR
jgi:site-specific DNA recombinase